MNNKQSFSTSKRVCNQCGSLLIEVNQTIREFENKLSTITSVAYRCSDPECQARIDKRIEELNQQKIDRAAKAAARAIAPRIKAVAS